MIRQWTPNLHRENCGLNRGGRFAGGFLNGRAQRLQQKRFADDEIHTAQRRVIEAEHFRIRRDQNDRLLGRERLDGVGEFISFHLGHGVVGHDEIVLAGRKHLQRLLGVPGGFHLMPVKGEHHPDGIAHEWFIIHYQDSPRLDHRRVRGLVL